MTFEAVIGLEIHTQLLTKSKIFSAASAQFSADANANTNEVDAALPGTLPVLNADVVRKAVLFGLAVGAEIAPRCHFDRKNYFYPDLPKGYQISQFDSPIVGRGSVELEMPDGSKRTCANFRTRASSGTPYCNAMLVRVPMPSIRPPMVDPSLAIVINSSPGWLFSNKPTVR